MVLVFKEFPGEGAKFLSKGEAELRIMVRPRLELFSQLRHRWWCLFLNESQQMKPLPFAPFQFFFLLMPEGHVLVLLKVVPYCGRNSSGLVLSCRCINHQKAISMEKP
jgi:hypothetical protein